MENLTVVRGNSGCGTTTFAAALAAHLAHAGIHTLLISPDTHIPAFGLWMPNMPPAESEKSAKSFGEALAVLHLDKNRLAQFSYIARKNLALLGYLAKEPSDKYNPVDYKHAEAFLACACELAERQGRVIVDATHYDEAVSNAAIQNAALQIRLIEPDPRGMGLLKSQPPEKFQGKTLWFSCARSLDDPIEDFAKGRKIKFSGDIPLLEEAHEKLVRGELFTAYGNHQYAEVVECAALAVREGIA